MTPEEHQSLQRFLQQIVQAGPITKQPEADEMIRGTLAKQPDAAYLLVQRAMLLEQALEGAKAQIAQLQAQQPTRSGSFLSQGANPWGAPATPAASSAVPSFLGNLASTAAGVAAGAFLFQGIEHLLHPQPGSWFGDHTTGWGGEPETVVEHTTVNNYYIDETPGDAAAPEFADYSVDSDDEDRSRDSSWI